MWLLDFLKRIPSKSAAKDLKNEYPKRYSKISNLEIDSQINYTPKPEYERCDYLAYYEQALKGFKVYLGKHNKFLTVDTTLDKYDLTLKKELMEQLQGEEKLSDYPESKQKELQAAVSMFVKNHLSEGDGYYGPYGYNASVEIYLENNKEIKIGIIDDADQPYIKATIQKHTGNTDFKYIGQYHNLPKPDFSENLSVKSIISKGTRPRHANKELDFER